MQVSGSIGAALLENEESPVTDQPVTPDAQAQQSSPRIDDAPTRHVPTDDGSDVDADLEAEASEQQASADEFAKEHDPADHDTAAGEELRQRGDWTADEAGGVQVWDAEGNLVKGSSPAEPVEGQGSSDGETAPDRSDADSSTGRRTSSLDEVRDGGYSVGSAALIEDGAMPLEHPVKAWKDTSTFVTPEDAGYDDGDPDLWFTDAGAAQRAGFRAAD